MKKMGGRLKNTKVYQPEGLQCNGGLNIIQEAVTKIIPKKEKCQKTK